MNLVLSPQGHAPGLHELPAANLPRSRRNRSRNLVTGAGQGIAARISTQAFKVERT